MGKTGRKPGWKEWESTPDWIDPVAVNRVWSAYSVEPELSTAQRQALIGRELTSAERLRLAERTLTTMEGSGMRKIFAAMVGLSGVRAKALLAKAAGRLGITSEEVAA
jgi:hypothetical protein